MLDYEDKPKKKKKHDKSERSSGIKPKTVRNFKIIDDDIDLNNCHANFENEQEVDLLEGSDAPMVVTDFKNFGIVKKMDYFTDNKWVKIDVCENEDGDMIIPESTSKSLFRKRGEKKKPSNTDDEDSDLEIPRRKPDDSDDDLQVPRKKKVQNDSDSDLDTVPRKLKEVKKEYSDDDISPMRTRKSDSEEEVDETKVRVRKKSKLELIKEEEKKRKKEEKLIKYMEWGKGLVQKRDREEKLENDLHEADKPMARYQDDRDLDRHLKQIEREDDPMAKYIKSKGDEGEAIDCKPKINAPKYRGPPAPANRYNLQPGYRWDGVDRSNGFEKRYYESINAKKARDEAAYKWSVEDM